MAINPATDVMPTSSFPVNVAVVEVDINRAVPDPSVESAQALVVSVIDSVSPTGGATEAKQDAGNASLDSIEASNIAIVASVTSIDTSSASAANALGAPSDIAWDGIAANASVVALLKAIWIKLP